MLTFRDSVHRRRALRRYVREGDIDAAAAAVALDDFRDGVLVTCDGPLARGAPAGRVELVRAGRAKP